jgi:long-chain acyl-CoA synthetase
MRSGREYVPSGYWRDTELTNKTIRDGWFHTGDLAYRDEQGFYWFVSRKSEIIKNEAGLVSPIEVEGALYAHAAVLEAGVVGVPDIFGGEILQAYVVLHRDTTPVTESQLIDFLQARLEGYKVPSRIILTESLPRGLTGFSKRRDLGAARPLRCRSAGGEPSRSGPFRKQPRSPRSK